MLTRIVIALVGSLGMLTSAPAQVASPAVPAATPSPAPLTLAERLEIAHLQRTLGAWWGGIAVIQGGKPILVKGYGYASETLKPFDADTLYDLGHISTQFTAAAVLRLEQDGKLALADPLSKYFPNAPASTSKITIDQLLRHRSGLTDKDQLPNANAQVRDEIVAAVLNSKLVREPGSQFEYSQRGYTLLAAIIEIASHQSFDDYLRSQIFAPAGMKNTGFLNGVGLDRSRQCARVGAHTRGDFSRGLVFPDDPEKAWNWGGRGAGGVVSNLNDLVAWDNAFRHHTILNEAQTTKMLALEDNNYAMGWYVNSTPRSTRYAWHGGSSQGLKALYFNYVDEDTSIIVLTNDSGLPDYTIYALQDVLFPPLPEGVRIVLHPGDFPRALDPVIGSQTAVELREPVVWSVTSIQGGFELALARVSDSKLIARMALTEGSLRRLSAQLGDVLLGKPKDDGTPTATTLTLSPYTVPASGIVGVESPVRIEARVLYRTLAADKSEVIDRRPTIVVTDTTKGRDPLAVRMDTKSATQLRDVLRSVIR